MAERVSSQPARPFSRPNVRAHSRESAGLFAAALEFTAETNPVLEKSGFEPSVAKAAIGALAADLLHREFPGDVIPPERAEVLRNTCHTRGTDRSNPAPSSREVHCELHPEA